MESRQAAVQVAPIIGRLRAWALRYNWVVALLAYAVMAVVVTFPLILHLGDSIAGPVSLWRQLLVHLVPVCVPHRRWPPGQDPSTTHLLYALLPHIQLFAVSDINGAAGAFLLSFMVPLAVFNLLVLINFALSGLTAYLLIDEFVPNRWAAFIAGSMYTFSTYHFWRVISGL